MASTAGSIVLGIFADVAQLKTDLQRANHEHRGLLRQGHAVALQPDEDGRRVCLGLRRHRPGLQWHRPRRHRQVRPSRPPTTSGTWPSAWASATDALQAYQYAARDVGADAEARHQRDRQAQQGAGRGRAGRRRPSRCFQRPGHRVRRTPGRHADDGGRRSATLADRIQRRRLGGRKDAPSPRAFFGKGARGARPDLRTGRGAASTSWSRKLREMGVLVEGDHSLAQADGSRSSSTSWPRRSRPR